MSFTHTLIIRAKIFPYDLIKA